MPASSDFSSGSTVNGSRMAWRLSGGASEAGVRARQKARYCERTAAPGSGVELGVGDVLARVVVTALGVGLMVAPWCVDVHAAAPMQTITATTAPPAAGRPECRSQGRARSSPRVRL